MKVEHYPIGQLKHDILAILGRYLDLTQYRVFFFGSRVTGRASDRSDIDVGIEGSAPLPANAWLAIQEEVEQLPTLYKVEIVDFKSIAPTFREVALSAIEPISTSSHDEI